MSAYQMYDSASASVMYRIHAGAEYMSSQVISILTIGILHQLESEKKKPQVGGTKALEEEAPHKSGDGGLSKIKWSVLLP